jgi:hypothetical protein
MLIDFVLMLPAVLERQEVAFEMGWIGVLARFTSTI